MTYPSCVVGSSVLSGMCFWNAARERLASTRAWTDLSETDIQSQASLYRGAPVLARARRGGAIVIGHPPHGRPVARLVGFGRAALDPLLHPYRVGRLPEAVGRGVDHGRGNGAPDPDPRRVAEEAAKLPPAVTRQCCLRDPTRATPSGPRIVPGTVPR